MRTSSVLCVLLIALAASHAAPSPFLGRVGGWVKSGASSIRNRITNFINAKLPAFKVALGKVRADVTNQLKELGTLVKTRFPVEALRNQITELVSKSLSEAKSPEDVVNFLKVGIPLAIKQATDTIKTETLAVKGEVGERVKTLMVGGLDHFKGVVPDNVIEQLKSRIPSTQVLEKELAVELQNIERIASGEAIDTTEVVEVVEDGQTPAEATGEAIEAVNEQLEVILSSLAEATPEVEVQVQAPVEEVVVAAE